MEDELDQEVLAENWWKFKEKVRTGETVYQSAVPKKPIPLTGKRKVNPTTWFLLAASILMGILMFRERGARIDLELKLATLRRSPIEAVSPTIEIDTSVQRTVNVEKLTMIGDRFERTFSLRGSENHLLSLFVYDESRLVLEQQLKIPTVSFKVNLSRDQLPGPGSYRLEIHGIKDGNDKKLAEYVLEVIP